MTLHHSVYACHPERQLVGPPRVAQHGRSTRPLGTNHHAQFIYRVLIVESRDEVYTGLRPMIELMGFRVARAVSVVQTFRRIYDFGPDLVLINGDLPNHAGWVMRGRLVLERYALSVWVYMASRPKELDQWISVTATDDVITHDGELSQFISQLCTRFDSMNGPRLQKKVQFAAA